MKVFVRRYPLVAFFALAYGGSWLLWSPWWLSLSGVGLLPFELPFAAIALVNQLGLFAGPFAAAFLVTHQLEGKAGVDRLWASITNWRVRVPWYLLALVVIPLAVGAGYLLQGDAGAIAELGGVSTASLLISTFFYYLLGGPVQEEPGWRGFALPRLQGRMHPLAAALLLGALHCAWHAPLFLTSEWDAARHDPGQYVAYLILVVSLSVVLSWLHNGSGGSVLLAILAHNSLNWGLYAAGTLLGEEVSSNWPGALGLGLLAVVAVLLTRGRLGYRGEPAGHSTSGT